ncbi:hypothetical protein O181_028880 [Austropuccinia psidii MF-1]|uniref:Reverse transcriptase domain-containing protein n=1 Tax=Austropuccinia psidii MF-1 TaxID=1389203 RepID=A0A9Q3CTK0_9BASI|nr:hypothetical protein [Austropuccinia psidii MF-1]
MLRRPLYPAGVETRKEIEKHINGLLEMDAIRKIGKNEIVEITTPVLITWHNGKYRFCGDFRALNNYTKADSYPIPLIPLSLDKLEKSKYITKMDCMKGLHHNGIKPNSMKLLTIICHNDIYEYTRMPFGIKHSPAQFQRIVDTIFLPERLEVWMVVYIDDIIHQGKSRVNYRQLTSCQAKVKQDKSQAHVKQKSIKRQAHITLLSYTQSCDIHQYWFPRAFNSDSSPPDFPATVEWLVKLTQDPPVCTHTSKRSFSQS